MSTDILYPIGAGSRYGNIELKYSLRSVKEHLSGVGNIFIVGELPDFINPESVIFIPMRESNNNWERAHNIYRKIMAGIEYSKRIINDIDLKEVSITTSGWEAGYNINDCEIIELSENFLFMNDDHFLLSDFEAGRFPYFHRGAIDLKGMMCNMPQFRQYKNTVNEFGRCDDYGVHCPIKYNKAWFKRIFDNVKWYEYGYEIKSAYASKAYSSSKWILCEDLKFKEPITQKESIYHALEGRQWFSTGDKVFRNGVMQEVLQELYPNKSKFEL